MFHTQYERHDRKFSNVGSRVRPIYSPVYDKAGVLDLEETGCENLYESIQSHRDSVDIHKILDRFQNGDVTALNAVQGKFGDFTSLPKTYAEALNSVISAENTFNSLPVETRAKFNHSFSQFLASVGSPEWLTAMNIKVEAMAEPQVTTGEATPAAGDDVQKGDSK